MQSSLSGFRPGKNPLLEMCTPIMDMYTPISALYTSYAIFFSIVNSKPYQTEDRFQGQNESKWLHVIRTYNKAYSGSF